MSYDVYKTKALKRPLEILSSSLLLGFPGGAVVKNLSANAENMGLIPGSGRSPRERNGNPLQYSSWEISWTEEPDRLQSMGSQKESDTTKQLNKSSKLALRVRIVVYVLCADFQE